MSLKDFFEKGGEYFLPNLSIDIVIIGYKGNELQSLLLKTNNKWNLPGGYIGINESVKVASYRILKELTGLENVTLNLLSVFGNQNRKFGDQFKNIAIKNGIEWKDNYWINERFVSITYYTLVDIEQVKLNGNSYFEEIKWVSMDSSIEMNLDHNNIILEARKKLIEDVENGKTCHDLLSEKFTMPELHQLHQLILDKEMDRSRFQKKILASGKFERLPKSKNKAPGRNPYLYKIIDDKIDR